MSPDRRKQLHDIYFEIDYILKNNAKNIVTERPAPLEELKPISSTTNTTTSTATATVVPRLNLQKTESFVQNKTSPRGATTDSTKTAEKPPTPRTPDSSSTPTAATTPVSQQKDDFHFFEASFPPTNVTPTAQVTKGKFLFFLTKTYVSFS